MGGERKGMGSKTARPRARVHVRMRGESEGQSELCNAVLNRLRIIL